MNENSPLLIADTAVLIGDVRLGNNANIWDGAVIRADLNYISIGENSNIQDNAVLHVEHNLPVEIGDNVTVGHGAIIHGARIESYTLVGMGAIILNNAEIGKGCIIGAGALIKENEKVPSFSLVVGVPGRIVKKLDKTVFNTIENSVLEYIKLAKKRIREEY